MQRETCYTSCGGSLLLCYVQQNQMGSGAFCLDSVILTTAASGCPQCTLRPLWRTNGAEIWHLRCFVLVKFSEVTKFRNWEEKHFQDTVPSFPSLFSSSSAAHVGKPRTLWPCTWVSYRLRVLADSFSGATTLTMGTTVAPWISNKPETEFWQLWPYLVPLSITYHRAGRDD